MPLRKIEQFFGDSVVRNYRKGQVILQDGDILKAIYYVRSGYVKMYTLSDAGETRTLMIFSPRTGFPIYPGILENSHFQISYYYETMVDTEVLAIPLSQFRKLLANNTEVAQLVLSYTIELSGDLVRQLEIIESKNANNKLTFLLQYLIRVCGQEVKPHVFQTDLVITQQDMADMTGLTRETVSLQVQELKKKGTLKVQQGKLIINQSLL